jgi:hypothetical protein
MPSRILDALQVVDEGRIEVFRTGETVGAVIAEPGREGVHAGYRVLQQGHCRCADEQEGPQRPCVHLLALEMVDALAQPATDPATDDPAPGVLPPMRGYVALAAGPRHSAQRRQTG